MSRRVEVWVQSETLLNSRSVTGTLLTQRHASALRDEPEHGLFVKLDRGGWVAIRSIDKEELPEWDERVAEWIERVQLEPEAL